MMFPTPEAPHHHDRPRAYAAGPVVTARESSIATIILGVSITSYASSTLPSYWPIFIAAFIVFLIGCGAEPTNTPTPPVRSVETPIRTSVLPTIAGATVIPEATLALGLAPTPSPTLDTPPTASPTLPSPGTPGATSTPETRSTSTPPPTPTRDSLTVPEATPADTPISVVTATPVPTAEPTPDRFGLRILSPHDGAGVEINAVRVLGLTRPDAVVAVNGTPVSISADGVFQHDLLLDEGENLIEVVATDLSGGTDAQFRGVFFVSPTAGIPLSIFYPADGLLLTEPAVQVIGGTRLDAVVGVNGKPVPVNELGIFSATVLLEKGANLIEVVAVDIEQNVNFQTVVVFYEP